jgi:two-component system chemotaxis sensor kinase CheA
LAAAIERKLIPAEDYARGTDDDILLLVFRDGVSTAGKVSDVSGRGIGMSALKAAVTASGGHIKVRSTLGEGTSFEIVVPKLARECESLRPSAADTYALLA